MLTASEREWLEDRKYKAYCRYCNVSKLCANPFASGYSCPLTGNMKDAAEFSERVAAKLAITGDVWDFEDMPCRGERQYMISKCPLRKNHWECADCYIKAARLQVEMEMDGDDQ